MNWSEERIQETIRFFKPDAEKLGQDFIREDAIESLNNVVALFELLIEIDQRLRKEEMPKLIMVIRQLQTKKKNWDC